MENTINFKKKQNLQQLVTELKKRGFKIDFASSFFFLKKPQNLKKNGGL